MTLDGAGQCRHAGGISLLAAKQRKQIAHNALVAAAVTERVPRRAQIQLLHLAAKGMDLDRPTRKIAVNVALRAHQVNLSTALRRECAHRKGNRRAPLQEQIHHLMIHHVVVAMIHAAAIGAYAQGFLKPLTGRLLAQHVQRPIPLPRVVAAQIELRRAVQAIILVRAVQTTFRRSLGCVLRLEPRQTAKGGHRLAALARQPQENIHVVAALLQDHRAGRAAVAPVAAHKAVRLMPVADLLNGLHGNDLADGSLIQNGL